jgi:Na+/glutamate symporter
MRKFVVKEIDMEWLFNGLGTALVGLVIGIFTGGAVGYRIGVSKNIKQYQKAGDNANQVQIGKGDNHAR